MFSFYDFVLESRRTKTFKLIESENVQTNGSDNSNNYKAKQV